MLRSITITALIMIGLFASGRAAGVTEPFLIRHVVLAGASGPAYYSVLEQGYRFVGGLSQANGTIGSAQIAAVDGGDAEGELSMSSLEETTEPALTGAEGDSTTR